MSKLWTILMLMSTFTCGVVTGHGGGSIKLIGTADNTLTVYVDGREVGFTNDWKHAIELTIPADTMVLAMKGVDFGRIACGIAATLSTGEVTDTHWKCSNKYQHNWASPYFDDSSWHSAVTFGHYGVKPWERLVAPDPYGASWIWVTGGCRHLTAYCRKKRDLGGRGRQLIATGDNSLTVYVDGEQVASTTDWKKAVDVNIPHHARFGKYGVEPWANLVSPQPLESDWIWYSGGCTHRTVYCRKWLE